MLFRSFRVLCPSHFRNAGTEDTRLHSHTSCQFLHKSFPQQELPSPNRYDSHRYSRKTCPVKLYSYRPLFSCNFYAICYEYILLLLSTFVNMLYHHLFLYGLLVKSHRIHMLQAKIPSNHLLTIERYRYFLIQFCPFPSSSALQFQSYPFFSSILPSCIFQLRSLQEIGRASCRERV